MLFDRPSWPTGTGVGLLPLDQNAIGQRWVLEPSQQGRYRVKSYDPSGAPVYLTRDGIAIDANTYQPGRTVNLYTDAGWISQVWELQRLN